MNFIQLASFIIIFVFYLSFFIKMILQKQKGIRTHQIGNGNKSKSALKIEKLLSIASTSIVLAEIISIVLDWRFFECLPLEIVGIVVALIGVAIFITAMSTMRDSWRAGINKNEKTELITNGIYKFSRNPAFLGFDLTYLGLMLAYLNPLLIVFTALAIIALHLQILEEEKFLAATFEGYSEYKKKTARYFLFF